MIFDELHIKVNSIIDKIDEIMVGAMVSNKEQIIDLNVSQLEMGLTKYGNSIEPEYSSSEYARAKKSSGSKAPIGIPDLKLTGSFHSGFYSEPYISSNQGASGLFIDSKDSKAESLEKKYAGIYGIMPKNSDEIIELILDDTQTKIINEITK